MYSKDRKRFVALAIVLMTSACVLRAADTETVELRKAVDRQLIEIRTMLDATTKDNEPIVAVSKVRSALTSLDGMFKTLLAENYLDLEGNLKSFATKVTRPEGAEALRSLQEAIISLSDRESLMAINDGKALIDEIATVCVPGVSSQKAHDLADRMASTKTTLYKKRPIGRMTALSHMHGKLSTAGSFVVSWAKMIDAHKKEDHFSAYVVLSRLRANSAYHSYALTDAARTVSTEVETELTKQLWKEMDDVRDRLAKAQTQAQILEAARRLQALSASYSNPSVGHPDISAIRSGRNIVSQWQRLVIAENEGDIGTALNIARDLLSSSYGKSRLLPREALKRKQMDLLKSMASPEVLKSDPKIVLVSDMLKEVDGIEGLPHLRSALGRFQSAIPSSGMAHSEVSKLLSDLSALGTAKRNLDARQYGNVLSGYVQQRRDHAWSRVVDKYWDQIQAECIRAQCRISGVTLPVTDDLEKELVRMADKAAADEDWYSVQVLLTAYQQAFSRSGYRQASIGAEITGCRSYLSGRNYEQAGVYDKAILAYLVVIQQVGKRVPTEDASRRLKALKEEHADAYEKATTPVPVPSYRPMLDHKR